MYNPEKFKLSQYQSIITPICRDSYDKNYMVYPSPNGYLNGIHEWRVRYIKSNGLDRCRSIGVTQNINEEWIHSGIPDEWPQFDKYASYWDGSYFEGNWREGETITVILNIDQKKVVYLRDGKQFKSDKIITTNEYYFALCIDSSEFVGATFESVWT